MRKFTLCFAALGGVVSLIGCTALLGTFDVSPTAGGSPDGASDAPDDGATDGGVDAAAFLLTCTQQGGVRTLDVTSPVLPDAGPNPQQSQFNRPLAMFRIGNGARLVYSKRNDSGFFVLTYSPKDSNGPTIVHNTVSGQILDVQRISATTLGVLSFDYAGQNTGSVAMYTIDDNGNGTAVKTVVSNPMTWPGSSSGNNGHPTGSFTAFGPDDYFVALGYPDSAPTGNSLIGVLRHIQGSIPQDPKVIDHVAGQNGGESTVSSTAQFGNKVVVFNGVGPDPNNPRGAGYYIVPSDAPTGFAAQVQPLTPPGSFPSLSVGTNGGPGGLLLTTAEIDFADASDPTPIVLRSGGLPLTKVGGFTSADVPLAASFASVNDVPFGDGSEAKFDGTDWFAIGPAPGGAAGGANFIWYDTKAKAVRARNTSANRLLASHTIGATAAMFDGPPTSIFSQVDVAWVEDTGAVQTLFGGMILCTK